MSDYQDYLADFPYGDGSVVLPGPSVESDWNPATRDYEDRTFKWSLVVGLEPTPDNLGFQATEATHYRLELTPDLGWSNVESMFVPYVQGEMSYGNSRLIVLDRLSLAEDLNNPGDTTASYTIPLDTFKQLLTPGYIKYLWRVRGITTSGDLGEPSETQVFRGRVIVANTAWSIDPVPAVSRSLTITLSGKKGPEISTIEVDGSTAAAQYLSPTTWSAEVRLAPGRNAFSLRAIDEQGNSSEYRTAETELTSKDLAAHSLWNRFDDFGYLLDVERLPEENNVEYKDRITDVFVHRAGSKYLGLMNGLNRELALSYYDQAILFSAATSPDTDIRFPDLRAWMTSRALYVTSARMRIYQEYYRVDPHSLTVEVDDERTFGPLVIESPIGVPIPEKDYKLGDGVISFKSQYAGQPVYLSYTYVAKIDLEDKTLEEMVDAMNALSFNDVPLLDAELGDNVDGDVSAEGLLRFPPIPLTESVYVDGAGERIEGQVPIRWSEGRLFAFMDKTFKEQFLNTVGSYFGTKYDGWASRMRAFIHTTWGSLVADENVWSDKFIRVSGIGTLDTIYDADRGAWISASSGIHYTTEQAIALNFLDPFDGASLVYFGIPASFFHSGVGDGDDLYVTLDGEDFDSGTEEIAALIGVTSPSSDALEDVDLGIGTNLVDSSSEVS